MAKNRFRFAKGKLSELPLPEVARATYYDAEIKRLALRVTHAGAKTFYVVKRTRTSVAWVKLGVFPEMAVERAREVAQKILGEFAAGSDPAAAKRDERKTLTLSQAFEQYMTLHVLPNAIRSTEDLRQIWERCLGYLPDLPAKKHGRKRTKHPGGVDWSSRKLNTISNMEVRALHAAIAETTPTQANRALELLSTVYNRAREWGYNGSNPAFGIRPFAETKRDRFIRHDELPKFFQALKDDSSDDFRHYILLSLLTGARRGNILAMKWEDIDFALRLWRIPDDVSKNAEPITVPLVSEAIEVLKTRIPKTDGFVFPAESSTGHMWPPKKRWEQLRTRAGLPDIRVHDLRRSMGSWQAITGASLAVIGKSLGHKSADATMIYARLSVDPVRQAMNTATSAMLEAGGLKEKANVKQMKAKKRKTAA